MRACGRTVHRIHTIPYHTAPCTVAIRKKHITCTGAIPYHTISYHTIPCTGAIRKKHITKNIQGHPRMVSTIRPGVPLREWALRVEPRLAPLSGKILFTNSTKLIESMCTGNTGAFGQRTQCPESVVCSAHATQSHSKPRQKKKKEERSLPLTWKVDLDHVRTSIACGKCGKCRRHDSVQALHAMQRGQVPSHRCDMRVYWRSTQEAKCRRIAATCESTGPAHKEAER